MNYKESKRWTDPGTGINWGVINYNLGYGKGRTPLLLENVQAYVPIAVDVGVEYLGPKCNLPLFETNVNLS